MTPSRRRLCDMTSTQVAHIERPILALPVGSCEQHGPHLPLGTDTIIAEHLCEVLANAHTRVVIGPSLTVTSSGEHEGFSGTLSIGESATSSSIIELVRSANWASSVVLVNGHGGNSVAVRHAVATLRSESRNVTDWWPRSTGDAHAGHVETSIMLHIAPDLVVHDRVEVGDMRPLQEIADALRSGGVRSVSANGVLGDPRSASNADGESLIARFTQELIDHVSTEHQ